MSIKKQNVHDNMAVEWRFVYSFGWYAKAAKKKCSLCFLGYLGGNKLSNGTVNRTY